MQGRLSPPAPHRLQAFPWSTWEQEFALAAACGIDGIEWLFELERYAENPLWTDPGVERIRDCVAETGVEVRSLCADYFMAHPLFAADEAERAQSRGVLLRLCAQAARVGIGTILLPVLETSELKTPGDRERLIRELAAVLPVAATSGIQIGIEAELPAGEYLAIVEEAGHPALGVYYDTGNAAARGFDVAADLRALGTRLVGVHLKDRRPRGGPTVPLGEGAVDFAATFSALRHVGYDGPLVMQPAVGPDYLGDAKRHVAFVRRQFASAGAHVTVR